VSPGSRGTLRIQLDFLAYAALVETGEQLGAVDTGALARFVTSVLRGRGELGPCVLLL